MPTMVQHHLKLRPTQQSTAQRSMLHSRVGNVEMQDALQLVYLSAKVRCLVAADGLTANLASHMSIGLQ